MLGQRSKRDNEFVLPVNGDLAAYLDVGSRLSLDPPIDVVAVR